MDFVNSLKTALLGSAVLALVGPPVLNFALNFFGCSGDDPLTKDIIEVAACTGGDLISIPVWLQKAVGGTVAMGVLFLTAFFKGGTVKENLLNKSVPVVPAGDNKPGVVTEAAVKSGA